MKALPISSSLKPIQLPEFYYKINSGNGAKQSIFLSLLPQAGVQIHVIQLPYVVYPFLRRTALQGATPEVGAMAPGDEARTLTHKPKFKTAPKQYFNHFSATLFGLPKPSDFPSVSCSNVLTHC
jgi:hypothetical protein